MYLKHGQTKNLKVSNLFEMLRIHISSYGFKLKLKLKKYFFSVTLEELYIGAIKKIELDRWTVCAPCKGTGNKSGIDQKCKGCDGHGFVIHYRRFGPMVQQSQAICTKCNGEGEIVNKKDKCKNCNGKKTYKDKKQFEVHVDKGMREGQRITFRGESHQQVRSF